MHPNLVIAKRAAFAAGKIIEKGYEQLGRIRVSSKTTPNDIVTNIDLASEAAIIEIISQAFPEHAILSEEKGQINDKDSHFCWVIDPLDGTVNFSKGYPHFAVSIALLKQGKPEIGLVYQPITGELFTATRGQGAELNDRRLRVNNEVFPERAVIETGFPYDKSILPYQHKLLRNTLDVFPDIRRNGSAALALCYLACGRTDGFFELNLQSWDIAAGVLIAQEAGAIISDCNGELTHLSTGNITAASPRIYKELIKVTRPVALELAEANPT